MPRTTASVPDDAATTGSSLQAEDVLHGQVRQRLLDLIRERKLGPGDRLLPERALGREFGVSRVTLRRALADLARDGVLVAHHGRGWYVAERPLAMPTPHLISLTEVARELKLPLRARVLRAEVRAASFDEAEALSIVPGSEIFELRRVRILDWRPVSLDCSRVPLSRAPSLPDLDFEELSLYSALEQNGCAPSQATVEVLARGASVEEAQALEMVENAPVLQIDALTLDQDMQPLDIGTEVFRGDSYRFRGTLSRGARDREARR